MDRYSKINERCRLKEERKSYVLSITQAEHKIHVLNGEANKNIEQIEALYSQMTKIRKKLIGVNSKLAKKDSELPILLFAVNESRTHYSSNYKPMWEYVYYYPDIDEIYKEQRPGTLSLNKNDVNLTDLFLDLDMPNEILFNPIGHDYDQTIAEAVNRTNVIIDQIFEKNEISTWSDVGAHLKKHVEKHNKESKKYNKHLRLI